MASGVSASLNSYLTSTFALPHRPSLSSPILSLPFPAGGVLRPRFRCICSSSRGGPGPGERDSKSVLDAFFLGKAVAEAITERIESTVGEFLSTVGRLQAEQQKQVQDFQEEVLERAKRAKEQAAREAMEEKGLVPTSTAAATGSSGWNASKSQTDVVSSPDSLSQATSNGLATMDDDDEEGADWDSFSSVSTDE